MKSPQVLAVLLVAVISSVSAGLVDQTYAWTDVSAGVAGTVAICFAFVGIGFLLYEINMRDYPRERRNDGTAYTQKVEEFVSGRHTYSTLAEGGAEGGSKTVEMTISGTKSNDYVIDSVAVNGKYANRGSQVDFQ